MLVANVIPYSAWFGLTGEQQSTTRAVLTVVPIMIFFIGKLVFDITKLLKRTSSGRGVSPVRIIILLMALGLMVGFKVFHPGRH